MSFHFDPVDDGLEFDFDLWDEPLVSPSSLLAEASDVEFSREEWLAFKQFEYAGYPTDEDPDSFVEDDAGEDPDPWGWNGGAEPIRVSQWQLQSDRDTLAHLQRDWRELYRTGPNGERVVRGAHPFSTDEGSAEWLQRARIEMRFLYREATSDQERSAIRAREAALRARHNARCWARAFARYHRLDENQTLGMLNAWQKSNPIGWLGLEKAMAAMFDGCRDDARRARARWEQAWNPAWAAPEFREEREAWLASKPVCPEYPRHLVTSSKTIRREERPVERAGELGVCGTPREVVERRKAEIAHDELAAARVRREARAAAPRVSRGNVRRWQREAQRDSEQFATRKEWERAEMPDFLPAPSVTAFEIGDGVEWQRGHLFA